MVDKCFLRKKFQEKRVLWRPFFSAVGEWHKGYVGGKRVFLDLDDFYAWNSISFCYRVDVHYLSAR